MFHTKFIHFCVISDTQHPERRAEVEQFIHTCYAKNYGADIHHFMPTLISIRTEDGRLIAALGFCIAQANTALFLENYLPHPVEMMLNQQIEQSVTRSQIVEIGNLAGIHPHAAQWLFLAFNAYLYSQGYQWAVSTLIPSLYKIFRRQGIPLIMLATAEKHCLTTSQQTIWGSYYDKNPLVAAGNIMTGYHAFEKRLKQGKTLNVLKCLWNNAYLVGMQRKNICFPS